jgi:hypothetical protein
MNWQKVILISVILFFAIIIWIGRYEIIIGGSGDNSATYRLDRWTGDVVRIVDGWGQYVGIKIKPEWHKKGQGYE